MADDLKRVGIKLTAEGARDFKSELKECTAATKENYSELKLAQSQYDKNTTATKKLEDRQKYLSQQSDVYKDKVKILNAQLEEMEKAENRDEVAISKKRAELNQAQAKLNEYEKSLEDVNKQLEGHSAKLKEWGGKLQDAGGKLKTVSDKMKSAGKTMTTHVTAPISAGAAGAVAAFNEIDAAEDILIQKTGAQGKAFEDMKVIMQDIATTIPVDFDTAANAVGEVNTKFGLTGEELESLSTKFIQFSELNNTDVSQAIDNTSQVMAAWGLNAKGASEYLDVLNRTSQNTAIPVENLSSKLINNQVALQKMGLDATDAVYMLGQLEMSGLNTDKVIGGLSKAYKYCATNGLSFNDTLAALQNEVVSSNGSTESLSKCYELFGKSSDQVFKALRTGKLDFADMLISQDALKDSMDSVGKTYQDTVDPIDEAKMAMNDAKLVGADLVTTAMPMIKDALEGLRDILKDLKNWWDGLSQGQQESILKFTMIAAVVGPILGILGSLIGIISGVSTVIGVLTTAIGALEATALPIIAIIAAIIAAITAIVLVIQNWGKITEWLGGLWEGFKDTVGKIWNGIASVVGGIVDGIKNTVGKAWEGIKSVTGTVFGAVKDFIGGTFNKAKDFVGGAVSKIKDGVSGAWDKVKSKTSEVFGNVKNFIVDNFNKSKEAQEKAVSKIKDGVVNAWNSIKSKTSEVFGSVKNFIVDNFNKSKQAQENILGKMKDGIGNAWNTIKSKTSSAFSSIKDTITNHMSNTAKANAKFGNAISNKLSGAWDAIKSKTGSTFSNIKDTVGDLMGGARDKVKGAIDKIKGFFNFKWSLPKIKLPHFKKSGKFSLNPPSVPSFSVDWYAKAYDRAAYYSNPTVREDGRGFGDRQGGEFAVGERHLQQAVRNGVAAASRNVSNNKNVTINITVNGAPGQDVMTLAEIVADRIKNAYEREDAVWA